MMQNGLGESFWDGLGVEIEACANFKRKLGISPRECVFRNQRPRLRDKIIKIFEK